MHGKTGYCHVLSGVVRQIKVLRYRLWTIVGNFVSLTSSGYLHVLVPLNNNSRTKREN